MLHGALRCFASFGLASSRTILIGFTENNVTPNANRRKGKKVISKKSRPGNNENENGD